MDSGTFNTEFFGLTVDAFTTGTLGVDGPVQRALAIQGDTHETSRLDIDVFDAPFGAGELLVITMSGFKRRGEIQGTTVELCTVAIGMRKAVGWMHTQAFGAAWDAIGITRKRGMAMLVLGDRCNASMDGAFLVDVPGIIGGISRDMDGKRLQSEHSALIERFKGGDIAFIEGLRLLGEHHISVVSSGRCGHPGAITPDELFFLFDGAIKLLLIGGAFDAEFALGITS